MWKRDIGGDPDHPDLWLKDRLLVMLDAAIDGAGWVEAIREVVSEMSDEKSDKVRDVLVGRLYKLAAELDAKGDRISLMVASAIRDGGEYDAFSTQELYSHIDHFQRYFL